MDQLILKLQINSKKLEAVWYGPSPENAPTLIFLHEGLGCTSMWRDFPQNLAQKTGCGALVFSRLGYGSSDRCKLPRSLSFMHHEALEVLPNILAQCRIKKHILVGHSDGASIALIYAAENSVESLLGIVIEAPHVFCEELTISSIEKVRKQYQTGNLQERLRKHHGANTDCAFYGWADVWLDPDFANWNIESCLPKIRIPQLIVQGKNDEYGTVAQMDAIVHQSSGAVETSFLDNCGHSPHRDQKNQTLDIMTEFIHKLLL
ncbi:MAG: alpha/beta hydrolase [SAR324 cluster bacterium]|nr:alpha/beta hydrolase [SAR324 cluster bacterium]MBL7034888.1 alpha/beta hydrolase [SAR324 cluster bacterium]